MVAVGVDRAVNRFHAAEDSISVRQTSFEHHSTGDAGTLAHDVHRARLDCPHFQCDSSLRAQAPHLSIMFVHSSKFVHKNIRPETVMVFADEGSRLGKCFLLGFEQFRPADGWTQRKGDVRLERQVYRHPSRQGLHPETEYVMQHDIYSLGVVLLETGLWTSFVEYDKAHQASLLSFIGTKEIVAEKQEEKRALALKARLSEAARYLPSRMGRIYTGVVKTCLHCLDDSDDNIFGSPSEFIDPDGITVAVRFAETVSESSCRCAGSDSDISAQVLEQLDSVVI